MAEAARGELEPLAELLEELYASVRAAVLRPRADTHTATALGRNPKGDVQKPFDLDADAAVQAVLESAVAGGRLGGLILSSEESGERQVGSASPQYHIVVDPVDGSDNWWRGLPLSAFSAAVLPAGSPLLCDNVLAGLVGELHSGTCWPGLRGRGVAAERCRQPGAGPEPRSLLHATPAAPVSAQLHVSGCRAVAEAFISFDLAHWLPSSGLAKLLQRARAVRSYGCASIAIALVAAGKLDAHVDVRGRLTPENYLAAGMLVQESGGCIVDERAESLRPAASLTEPKSVIAAASFELAKEIAHVLASG